MNREAQRTLYCYFTTVEVQPSVGRMLLSGLYQFEEQTGSFSFHGCGISVPRATLELFFGRQETSKVSTPHKDKGGVTPLCVHTHVHT